MGARCADYRRAYLTGNSHLLEIDQVTGLINTREAKLFGLVGDMPDDVSPLELWLREHGDTWTPDWQRLRNYSRSL